MLQSHRTWLANTTEVANGPHTGTPFALACFRRVLRCQTGNVR